MIEYIYLIEIKDICFDLDTNDENVPGLTLTEKVRELINYCHRYDLLTQLLRECKQSRPTVPWPQLDGEGYFISKTDIISGLVSISEVQWNEIKETNSKLRQQMQDIQFQ